MGLQKWERLHWMVRKDLVEEKLFEKYIIGQIAFVGIKLKMRITFWKCGMMEPQVQMLLNHEVQ